MARVTTSHRLDLTQLQRVLAGPQGGVARDLTKRLIRVESAAKRRISANPKRVDTGRLRASITWEIRQYGQRGALEGRVGTNVSYARYVHDGTGIYGPYSEAIRPRARKAMRWPAKRAGARRRGQRQATYTYATYVLGMKPNPFLRDALPAAGRAGR